MIANRCARHSFSQWADERLKDAKSLQASGRWNGAMYMCGFFIECMLKGLLLERHPNLKRYVDAATLSKSDSDVYNLIYRSHDLERMLTILKPEIQQKLSSLGVDRWKEFSTRCTEWSIYIRYSPLRADREQASAFIEAIEEVREWLRQL